MARAPELSNLERVKPDIVIDAHSMQCILAAFESWSKEVADPVKALAMFRVAVYKTPGATLVRFIAKREPDELSVKGGRCKNGQDVQYEIGENLEVRGVSYFK